MVVLVFFEFWWDERDGFFMPFVRGVFNVAFGRSLGMYVNLYTYESELYISRLGCRNIAAPCLLLFWFKESLLGPPDSLRGLMRVLRS